MECVSLYYSWHINKMREYNHLICHCYCHYSVSFHPILSDRLWNSGEVWWSLLTLWVKSYHTALAVLFLILSIISTAFPYVFRRKFKGFPSSCSVPLSLRVGNTASECRSCLRAGWLSPLIVHFCEPSVGSISPVFISSGDIVSLLQDAIDWRVRLSILCEIH